MRKTTESHQTLVILSKQSCRLIFTHNEIEDALVYNTTIDFCSVEAIHIKGDTVTLSDIIAILYAKLQYSATSIIRTSLIWHLDYLDFLLPSNVPYAHA